MSVDVTSSWSARAPMLNATIDALGVHPFVRVAKLLAEAPLRADHEPLDLTIGEPRFPPPAFLMDAIVRARADWGRYPPNDGPEWFRAAAASWLERRFDLVNSSFPRDAIVPTAGAREALFQLGLLVASVPGRTLLAMPTPHYAPYRAAALMAGLEPFYMPALPEGGFLPDLSLIDAKSGPRLAALIVCTPSNPEGAVASTEYLERAVRLARLYGFLLIVDECYSELYLGARPDGVLSVCSRLSEPGSDTYRNVVSVHSLSKRSSAAGLRAAFVCGDRNATRALVRLRAYCGGTTPLPCLSAAAALLEDEEHVDTIRGSYRVNFDLAHAQLADIHGYHKPQGGMFLWLAVQNDEAICRRLWSDGALRVVPGSYLGTPAWDGSNHLSRYVRVAMTYPARVTERAMKRLRACLLRQEA